MTALRQLFERQAAAWLTEFRASPDPARQAQLLHTLKGAALALEESVLAARCHQAETALAEGGLDAVLSDLLASWLAVLPQSLPPALDDVQALAAAVHDFTRITAGQLGQACRMQVDLHPAWLQEQDLLWAMLPHLLRNALTHGGEAPSVRVAAGKPAALQLVVRGRCQPQPGTAGRWTLLVADDGPGRTRSTQPLTLWQGRGQGVPAVRAALAARAGLDGQARLRWRGQPGVGSVVWAWCQPPKSP